MRILLIGGAGFVGEALAEVLVRNSENKVVVIHHRPLLEKERVVGVDYLCANASERDNPLLANAMTEMDTVVFLTQPQTGVVENIVDLFKKGGKRHVSKIVYLSSLLLYADSHEHHDETAPLDPRSDYENGKYHEEILLKEFTEKNGIILCVSRLSNVYGGPKNRGFVGKLLRALMLDQALILNGDGSQTRDFIFIEDVARWLAFLITWNQIKPADVFNLCSGEGHNLNKVISIAERLTLKKVTIMPGAETTFKKCVIGKNGKIIQTSGQSGFYGIEDGLALACSEIFLAKNKQKI